MTTTPSRAVQREAVNLLKSSPIARSWGLPTLGAELCMVRALPSFLLHHRMHLRMWALIGLVPITITACESPCERNTDTFAFVSISMDGAVPEDTGWEAAERDAWGSGPLTLDRSSGFGELYVGEFDLRLDEALP